jgi:hypothetical protein
MKNITQFPRAARNTPSDVVVLNCPQQLYFDPAPLQQLFGQRELHVAEEVVCRMLEDIALRLDMLQRGLAARDFELMHKPAKRIVLVAKQLGLVEVAMTADHVRTCLTQADGVAIEATMARLERGFDVAVSEIWNFRDL